MYVSYVYLVVSKRIHSYKNKRATAPQELVTTQKNLDNFWNSSSSSNSKKSPKNLNKNIYLLYVNFLTYTQKQLQVTRGTQGAWGVPGYSYIATPENLRNPLLTTWCPYFRVLYSINLPTISLEYTKGGMYV